MNTELSFKKISPKKESTSVVKEEYDRDFINQYQNIILKTKNSKFDRQMSNQTSKNSNYSEKNDTESSKELYRKVKMKLDANSDYLQGPIFVKNMFCKRKKKTVKNNLEQR